MSGPVIVQSPYSKPTFASSQNFDIQNELAKNAYQGKINSDEAKYRLGNNGSFVYLVRDLNQGDSTELKQKGDGTPNQYVLSFINKEGNFEESGIRFAYLSSNEPFFDNGRPNHVGDSIKNLAWTIMDCDPEQPTTLK